MSSIDKNILPKAVFSGAEGQSKRECSRTR